MNILLKTNVKSFMIQKLSDKTYIKIQNPKINIIRNSMINLTIRHRKEKDKEEIFFVYIV